MDISFTQQILLTVIDKGLLGSGIVIAGYVATRGVERYKARQALLQAIAPERIKRITEQSRKIADIIDRLDTLVSTLSLSYLSEARPIKDNVWASFWVPHAEATRSMMTEALSLSRELNSERFWLGSEETRKFLEWLWAVMMACSEQQVRAYIEGDIHPVDGYVSHVYRSVNYRRPKWFGRILGRDDIPRLTKDVDELVARLSG